ncbi:hypothetical protein HKBW3S03_00834 [Candidatus Hakubella thermalkaliphila]|uniref:DUF5615 domain-containing protein n=1 Tax=Candidatus Hakubella thermalkaliphila TaxID=2754717 RepID=A0A6V8Q4V1_9ACTN|nr:DUF5615 family PIN-like protein [Candidatus Hakubella thermalkaliphila]GFP19329.1 hypothetical protein HKBW3S03_00834 [Candidatus Hakubella thermalkaliphila]GFP22838.1 hypothetical protein HKBW3S09_00305 [Candidatus Hakubella thermalkaliphila]GFP29531.1 hypothetical protein HKBW3S34_00451 [Candidatus Hakubella thermalkaliphila]GFP38406.1 hypothetical protein HKBW3S47_00107 [Candidatus Hakubella thermalkaliphila]GFP40950.1 hypothetical protein HKBW3C_00075 [Candidatus Hakubella thermalkaliph
MPISLYLDEHVPRAITVALRIRGVDVIAAQEDKAVGFSDTKLLDRAADLKRVLFTHDDDLLAEATRRQEAGIFFCGVIYAHPLRISIGACINDLEIIAQAGEPEDLANRVEFLPL